MERDIIIIVEGGAMLGVFGAGVVTAFQEANIYDRVHSVYGASAGAHDLAYFLAAQADAQQVKVGSSIYYEDLARQNFIRPYRLFRFLTDLIIRRFRPSHRIRHLLDLDYLMEVEKTSKKLNVRDIVRQPIPFFVAVYDIENKRVVFVDGKQDTLQSLKASSSAPPFYAETVEVRGRRYLDGGLIQNWDADEIIRQHPGKKVVYVMNNKKSPWFTFVSLPYYCLEALLNVVGFGWGIGWTRLKNAFSYATEGKLRGFPNVTLVANALEFTNSITDPDKLLSIYHHGHEAGRAALQELDVV
ncbi:MAG: patatin-like phospholipase family protein [Patescibacteria group bacterium]